MKTHTVILFATVALILIGSSASAQHYTDWSEFEYTEPTDEVDFYILERDYTISLPSYFTNSDNLHWRYKPATDFLHNWAMALPPCDWDFVRIDFGAILTIKKGFRWDGASLPGWRDLERTLAATLTETYCRGREAEHRRQIECLLETDR